MYSDGVKMNTLRNCYEGLKREIIQKDIEPFEIVEAVENYRSFWKPDNVRIILLGESHVYTNHNEFNCKIDKSKLDKVNKTKLNLTCYPKNFVRFVYCLASGESELLEDKKCVQSNRGSWQFWEDFFSCCNKIDKNNYKDAFKPILKTKTKNFPQRINNKLNLLLTLKGLNIWLVDASIIGLYKSEEYSKKEYNSFKNRVISYCWENHTRDVISQAQPEFMICIGKTVAKIIKKELLREPIRGRYCVVKQPQGRRNTQDSLSAFQTYYRICSEHKYYG